jgi:hypothetical protein
MSTITKNNPFFFNEQERWFMSMTSGSIHDVSLEILSTEMSDERTGVVSINQKHKTNESFDFDYPLLFKYEEGQWKDYGYNFEVYETERFTVKYMAGEKRVEEFAGMLDDAYDHLAEIYSVKPLEEYEMKLFYDREMLRQRCIPESPWLFTGWSEPDESLKVFTGHPSDYKSYPGVVQHELVHNITIRICNNNLPVWILEGIAMHDGSAYYDLNDSSLLSQLNKKGVSKTIRELEVKNLSTNLNKEEIANYYNTSYMIVKYIVDEYGHAVLMDLFYEAGKKPFHDSTLNKTFEVDNQKTAEEVFMKVLGLSTNELSEAYLNWLEAEDI